MRDNQSTNTGNHISVNQAIPEVIYQIDANDRLTAINNQWDLFATENHSPRMTREYVTNQPLWNYIHDAESRHLHRTLLTRVRQKDLELTLPFRCDAPDMRRFMEMRIMPLDNDAVEYRCRTLKSERREPVTLLDPRATHNDDGKLLRMCSWCKKIDTGPGGWLEVENAITLLHLFDETYLPRITHTVCKTCLLQMDIDG